MARGADDAKVACDKMRVKLSGDGGGSGMATAEGAEAATAERAEAATAEGTEAATAERAEAATAEGAEAATVTLLLPPFFT